MATRSILKRFGSMPRAPVYASVVDELRGGRKRSHWMWFVFPQAARVGQQPEAARYGITSLHEARAYLHPRAIGPRLREVHPTGQPGAAPLDRADLRFARKPQAALIDDAISPWRPTTTADFVELLAVFTAAGTTR